MYYATDSRAATVIMDFPHVVLARLYEHIEPIDRGERYEDPLQAALEHANIGRERTRGGRRREQ